MPSSSSLPQRADVAPLGGVSHGVRHLGVIMDGNGRWAKARGLPRFAGHRAGVEAVRRLVKAAIERNIGYVTIYSFSTENWSRPVEEVQELMRLLKLFIRSDLARLHDQNVRVRIIGDRESLSPDLIALLTEAEAMTATNAGLTLAVAFNYGARQEIVRAVRQLGMQIAAGRLSPDQIQENSIAAVLDTADMPDPDLILRTSGEQRLSNFLLWQAAYAEFVFLPGLWPDFDGAMLDAALTEYSGRVRRFGGV